MKKESHIKSRKQPKSTKKNEEKGIKNILEQIFAAFHASK